MVVACANAIMALADSKGYAQMECDDGRGAPVMVPLSTLAKGLDKHMCVTANGHASIGNAITTLNKFRQLTAVRKCKNK